MVLQILVTDHTGNTSTEVKITNASTPVAKLLPALINALSLPMLDAGGYVISYNLSYKQRRLHENESLESVGVTNGDRVHIVPEMTAGARDPVEWDRAVSSLLTWQR